MQVIFSSFALAMIASLPGCVTTEEKPEMPGCRMMDCIGLGESVEVGRTPGDLIVKPLEVVEDSRCPIEADCIWEGEIKLRSELTLGHEVITVDLTTQEPLRINRGMLSIAEVAPEVSVEWMPIPNEAYRFGFVFAPDMVDSPAPN